MKTAAYRDMTLAVRMEPFPPVEVPSLDLPEAEITLLKDLPQIKLYHTLADFSSRHSLDPVKFIQGEVSDYEHLVDRDWQAAKWTFYLYSKVKLDVQAECEDAKFTDHYF